MSIQSFTDSVLLAIDKAFEDQANHLLNEARSDNKRCQNIAGRMDGLSDAARIIKKQYALFVATDRSDDDDSNDEMAIY